MFAEVSFSAGSTQLCEMWVDLAEGCEYLSMRCSESIAINSAGSYERGSHIPIADYHTKRGISLPTDECDQVGKIFRIEFADEPVARFAKHRFAAEIKELKV